MGLFGQQKEKLICVKCRYETDYQGTYKKPPVCPTCRNLLSFKDSLEASYEEEIPLLNKILLVLALAAALISTIMIGRHFKSWDNRALITNLVSIDQPFYGGRVRAKIPKQLNAAPFVYGDYWANKTARAKQVIDMVNEEHRYLYQGVRSGQVYIQYVYSAGKKKGSHLLMLPLKDNAAVLNIPALPYVKGSKPVLIKIEPRPGNQARISQK